MISKLCTHCGKEVPLTDNKHWRIKKNGFAECKIYNRSTRRKSRARLNLAKYGTETPRKDKDFHKMVTDKRNDTLLKKYGVSNAMKSNEFKERQKESLMESYGVEVPSKSPIVSQKIKDTNLKKYGVSTNLQLPEVIKKARESKQDKLSILLSDGTRLRDWCDSKGISRAWAYKIYKHSGEEALKMYSENYAKRISNLEIEFINIMKDLEGVSFFNRHPAKNVKYRPDFFLQRGDKSLYVNVDGMYYHSEAMQPDKEYHRKMRIEFEEGGLRLMQFTGVEIMESPEIIKSMIGNYFNENKSIGARQCEISKIDPADARLFFEDNHIMGAHPASTAYGLMFNEELFACMSIRVVGDSIHIERFANKIGYTISGGFSKLLQYFAKNIKIGETGELPQKIVSFCDLRYSSGGSYIKNDFEKVSESLGFTWTNGVAIFNRLHCRANMDERRLPEAEYAKEMGLFRLYDAGQAKYVKLLKN